MLNRLVLRRGGKRRRVGKWAGFLSRSKRAVFVYLFVRVLYFGE